ncbi:MAG: DUF6580 family putative transport protein [Gammaproteobacteria bacterium]
MNKQTILIAAALVLFAVLSRFVPHPVNFTPIAALGLFAGAFMSYRRYWLLPLLALLLSDLFLGFYHWVSMLFVYLGFAGAAVIGRLVLSSKQSPLRIGGAAFASTNVFFILSNFGTWLSGTLYPLTFEGLAACYVAAIPFYPNSIAGDLFYSFLLFGLFALLQQTISNKTTSTA